MSRRDDWTAAGRTVLRRLVRLTAAERLLISVAAVFASILVGALIVLAAGRLTTCSASEATYYFGVGFCYDPVQVYLVLFNHAFGGPLALGEPQLFNPEWTPFNRQFGVTLKETTLLVFTGLSVAVAFRAGLFNIGTQGQLIVGALFAALAVLYAAPYLPSGTVGGLLLVPLGLAAGAAGGGIYGMIPGVLKAYANANEVITTIMLNFVAANLAAAAVLGVFRDPGTTQIATRHIPSYAELPTLAFPASGDFSLVALLLALVGIAGLYYLLERTAFGYDVRASGVQPEAAEYGGVDSKRTTVGAMGLSGALGGLAGAIWVLMSTGRWTDSVPSLGFDGITVSILAGNNPLGVLPAAFLFGTLKGGNVGLSIIGVPPDLVAVLRGLIILFVAMPEFFRMVGKRVVDLEEPPRRTAATDGGESDE